jgi:MFS transporter, UMF1 family
LSEIQTNRTVNVNGTPRKAIQLYFSLPILSWALYDFANTIFSSNITTIFFPFYLQEVIGKNEVMNQIASTLLSYANAIASFFLVIFTPLFGVLIDRTGRKKRYIVRFTMITVLCTVLMGLFATWKGEQTVFNIPLSFIIVVFLFIIAKFFYHSSLVFYDTMISDLGSRQEIPLISGFGVAVGYIGTLAGLAIYPIVGENSFEKTFIPSAFMFLLFSLPLFFFVKETYIPKNQVKKSFISGYKEIIETFKEMKFYRGAFIFLIAYFFINDAISTAIAMMSVYAKTIVGFSTGQFIMLYLVSTISSIIGSFIFGYITKKTGAKRAVSYVAILLIVALTIACGAVTQWMFWICGSLFGVSLGATWVASRTLIVELTPEEKRGQFFGLFAFSGKVSSIIGPFIYGSITLVLADYGNAASRIALGSLIVLVFIGLFVHFRVPYSKQTTQ